MNSRDDKISRLSSLAIILLLLAGSLLIYKGRVKASSQQIPPVIEEPKEQVVPAPIREEIKRQQEQDQKVPVTFALPISEFGERITKKPFGIYITPQNSPVQPERFTGYHTAADVEYGDISGDVSVFAIANGKIVLSQIASGYGGVFMMEFDLDGTKHNAIYGHIRPSSLPAVGRTVVKSEQIGLLGSGFSTETDGERKHLHFGVLSNNRLDIRGYVFSKSQLSGWIDPLTLFP